MKSEQARIAEAIASLAARMAAEGVENPTEKAERFIRDMLAHGWRPIAPKATLDFPTGPSAPPPDLSEVRKRLEEATLDHQRRERAHLLREEAEA